MPPRVQLCVGAGCAATIALLLGPAARADAAPRACTASDLEGTRAPAMLRDHGLDTQDGPLIAGTPYQVVVVQELALGDHAEPVDGSIAISAPNGPALMPTTEDGRPAYDFVPATSPVRLVVSWQERVGGYGSDDICAASQAFDIPVVSPRPPRVTGKFSRGARTFESSFALRLLGDAPPVPEPVIVVLRARRGTTKPPAPSGTALARFTFTPAGSHFEGPSTLREFRHTFYADTSDTGIRIYPYPDIPFGRTLRFAFSIEVVQKGRRLGGMRSGATCRRVQFTGHSAVKCRAVGFAQRP